MSRLVNSARCNAYMSAWVAAEKWVTDSVAMWGSCWLASICGCAFDDLQFRRVLSKPSETILRCHSKMLSLLLHANYATLPNTSYSISIRKQTFLGEEIKTGLWRSLFRSSWVGVQRLPENYVLPPGKIIIPPCNTIPVIDLSMAEEGHESWSKHVIVEQVLEASQEFVGYVTKHRLESLTPNFTRINHMLDFGYWQVINHGVSEKLMDDEMNLFKECFRHASRR